jgi:putative ABC transport system substrate-binding protein
MRRRRILAGLFLSLVAPLAAEAQQGKAKVPRIGVIWAGWPPPASAWPTSPLAQFHHSLHDLGYVEGQSIAIDSRFAGDGSRLVQQVEGLIQLKVDVIVAMSTAAAWVAKSHTTAVPVVFSVAGDPVQFRLIESLARPGGNLTGFYTLTAEHSGKRLGLLREAVPRSVRTAVLWNPSDPLSAAEFREAQTAAHALTVQLVPLAVRTADDIEMAFHAAKKAQATTLTVLTSPRIVLSLRRVAELSLANGLPAVAAYPAFAEVGGLMAYGATNAEVIRRTAAYVDKILKGARPADVPAEQATKFELVINLKTAKALGLTIPPSLLARADQVIE